MDHLHHSCYFMLSSHLLDTYLGLNIRDICPNGYTSNDDNHWVWIRT